MKGVFVVVLAAVGISAPMSVSMSASAFAQDNLPKYQCRALLHHGKDVPEAKAFDLSDKCFPAAPGSPCNYTFIDTTGTERKITNSYFQKIPLNPSQELTGSMIVTKDDTTKRIEVDLTAKLVEEGKEEGKDAPQNKQVVIGSTVLFLPSDTPIIHAIVYSGAGTEEFKGQSGAYEKQPSLEVDCSTLNPGKPVAIHSPLPLRKKSALDF